MVPDDPPNPTRGIPQRRVHRCERCEVTWRSLPGEPCWSCGGPGVAAGEVIVVSGR